MVTQLDYLFNLEITGLCTIAEDEKNKICLLWTDCDVRFLFSSEAMGWGHVSSRMIGANLHYLQPLVPLDHTTPELHPQQYTFQKTIVSYATKTQKKN